TRSRSEAGIAGWSARLGVSVDKRVDVPSPGVNAGTRVGVSSPGVDAGKGVGEPSAGVDTGKRVGLPSGSRVPNFFVTGTASSTIPSAGRRHPRSPVRSGRGNVAVLLRA